jgi:hypothetical protein
METSNSAGPRLDEDLKRETRGGLDARDPGADREHTEEVLRLEVPGAAPDAVERSDMARFLAPSVFPARPKQLLEVAQRNFAPEWVTTRLAQLPDRPFDTVQEVWEATH